MKRIGDFVEALLRDLGLEGAYREYRVLKEAQALLPPSVRPVRFRQGVLFLEAMGAAQRFSLTFQTETLRQALNAQLGAPWVQRIYILSPRRREP